MRTRGVTANSIRKTFAGSALAVLALFVALGCGGGGGSSASGGAGSGGTDTGGSGSSATISDTQKGVLMGAITTKMKALGDPSNYGSLPAYAKTLSGVLDAVTQADGNISIVLNDGQWLEIFTNRDATPPGAETPYPTPGALSASRQPTRDIATGTTFRIIEYFDPAADINTKLQSMFQKKGYTSIVATDASIQNIKNVNNADAMFLDTHGGTCAFLDPSDPAHKKTILTFGVLLNNLAPYAFDKASQTFAPLPNAKRDAATDALLKSGAIGIAPDPDTNAWHLVASSGYLGKTWKFPHKSILFNSVCDSDTATNQAFKKMCQAAGAGVFVGYDETVLGSDAANDAGTLFEGLLGTHLYNTAVIGRAWNVKDFYSAMVSTGKTVHHETLKDGTIRTANMLLTMGTGNFTGLAPGIQYMFIKEVDGTLAIVGDFGSETGTVKVNGQPIDATWGTQLIQLKLPLDPNSPQFAGPVVVTVHGHDSNQVSIIKYVGDVHYEHDDIGTLVHAADFHLVLRGDVHLFRTTPFADLARPATILVSVDASTAKYASVGEFSYMGGTTAWDGSGTLQNGGFHSTGDLYSASIRRDAADAKGYGANAAHITFDFSVLKGYHITENGQDGGTLPLSPDLKVFTTASPPSITLPTDASMNITVFNGPQIALDPTPFGTPICFVNANFTATPKPDVTKQEDESN